MKFLTNVDFKKNQLLNARIENLTSAPLNPVEGLMYYNTTDKCFYIYQDGAWVNHTNFTHDRITDFDDAVKAIKLNEMTTPDAEVSMGGQRITNVATPVDATDAVNKAYVDMSIQGLDLKAPVRVATTGAVTLSGLQTIDGVELVAGDAVLVKDQADAKENGVYTVAEGAWLRRVDFDDVPETEIDGGEAVFVQEGTQFHDCGFVLISNSPVSVGTDNLVFEQFSGAGQVVAGEGLSKVGNQMNVNVDGTTIEINGEDTLQVKDAGITDAKIAAGVDAAKIANGSVSNTEFQALDGVTGNIQAQINAEISARQTAVSNEATARAQADSSLQGNIDAEATARASADTTIQTELDATQTGAGLGANGAYVADATTNYIKDATSLKDADKKLDAQVKANYDDLAGQINSAVTDLQTDIADLQTEIDATQVGAGLDADGDYTPYTDTNYINTATSLKNADFLLDSQIKTVADGLASEISNRGTAESALQTAIDNEESARETADSNLQTSINTVATNLSTETTNRTNADTNLQGQINTLTSNLSTESTTRSDADIALQSEINATQTGAGLGTDGSYTADATTNYIKTATSLKDADKKLDSQIKANADAIVSETTSRTNADTALSDRITALENGGGAEVTDTHTRESNYTNELFDESYVSLEARLIDIETVVDAQKTALDTEATNRANADTTLQNNIDAEATARANAVTGVQNNLNTEITNRTSADTTLQNNIDSEASARQTADATLQTNINTETSARQTADQTLNQAISDETTRATGAEEALDARLDVLEAVVNKYAQNIGNGTDTSIVVTHNLNTTDVLVQLKEVATNDVVYADINITSANTVTISFSQAPTTNEYRVVVLK